MNEPASAQEPHAGSRLIRATPEAIYRACLDPAAVASWRPPAGMRAEIESFDAREGGRYRMAFVYTEPAHATAGKSSMHRDEFQGRFVALQPNAHIVEAVEFVSDDPAFAGTMTVTTTLREVPGSTEVRIAASDVPRGIKAEDHRQGIASTLANLAAFVE